MNKRPISVRAETALDVDKQGLVNSLIDTLGLEGVRCAGNGIPKLADKTRGLTREMVARVLAVAARRAGGATWQELADGGDPWCRVNPIAQKSAALARIFKAGEDAFISALAKRLEGRLAERALNPKKRYVTGRVAKDTDGVLRHPDTGELLEVEPDNGKILEFALAKIHPRFKDDKGVSVARQNVYNITVIPPPRSAERVVFADVPGANRGGNPAEIPPNTS